MILNRRTLLATIGLALPAAAAEAASSTKKKKPAHGTHTTKASTSKSTHHKSHITTPAT